MSAVQLLLDLSSPSTFTLVGTKIALDNACPRCGGTSAVVGSSKAMHHAALHCAGCGHFLKWMPGWQWNALNGAQIVDGSALETSHYTTGLSSAVPW
jgi:hypothetical protein